MLPIFRVSRGWEGYEECEKLLDINTKELIEGPQYQNAGGGLPFIHLE